MGETTLTPAAPTIRGSYGHAWRTLRRSFSSLLLVSLVSLAFNVPPLLVHFAPGASLGGGALGIVVSLAYQLLVLTPVSFGALYAYLRAVRGRRPRVADLWVPFRRGYLACVLAGVLAGSPALVGALLLLVPLAMLALYAADLVTNVLLLLALGLVLLATGIFLAVRLSFVPFIVIDERLSATAAVKASWQRTAGHGWLLLGVGLSAIPVCLVGLLLLVVGIVPASMWATLAFASFYEAVTARDASAPAAAGNSRSSMVCEGEGLALRGR